MEHLRYFLVLIFVLYLTSIKAERTMRPKMKDIKIWSDNSYVTHSVVFDAADPHVNLSVTALQELHDLDMHFEGNIVQKKDPNYFFSFNTTVNLCRIINWRNLSPIGNIIHAYMKEYGNLIETCPVAKGQYFIHKFWIPEDSTTATLPEVDFDIRFSAYHLDGSGKRTLIANDEFVGEAVVQDVSNIKSGILAMLPRGG